MYYAIQCKTCGKWRSCQVKDVTRFTFRCFDCGKSAQLTFKKDVGLILKHEGPFEHPKAAMLVVQEKNQ
jgi:phage terminase large subunit GpA-like protein